MINRFRRSSFAILVIVLYWVSGLNALAKNHTDFMHVPVPSPHMLESIVGFSEDLRQQLWMISDAGLSVYRDNQFISYRAYDFNQPISSFVIVDEQLLITVNDQLYSHSLLHPDSPIKMLWQSPNQSSLQLVAKGAISLEQSNVSGVWLQAGTKVLQLDLVNLLLASEPNRADYLHQINNAAMDENTLLAAAKTGLWLADTDQLSFYSAQDRSWQSVAIEQPIKQIAALDDGVVILSPNGDVVFRSPFSRRFIGSRDNDIEPVNITGGESLAVSADDVYVRREQQLISIKNPTFSIFEPSGRKQVYIDDNLNTWVSTLYDIQVAWWHAISVANTKQPNWAGFGGLHHLSSDKKFAIKNGGLYTAQARGQGEDSWLYKTKITSLNDNQSFTKLLNDAQYLWLWQAEQLSAINQLTLVVSYEMSLTASDIVIPYNKNGVLVVTNEKMLKVAGNGQTSIIQAACSGSCLPKYKINNSLLHDKQIWLATNQGLQRFDITAQSFSKSRIDQFNELAPVLTVLPSIEGYLWLVYPNKVAHFNIASGESDLYYSEPSRIFDANSGDNNSLVMNTQRGWVALSAPQTTPAESSIWTVQHVADSDSGQFLANIEQTITLANDKQQVQLAFNVAKQHPNQFIQVRYKYLDDNNWQLVSRFANSITLTDLRQGQNELEVQLRLEGKDWAGSKKISYLIPYKYFQTKWVLTFVAVFLIIIFAFIAYERISRVKVVFNSMQQQAFISSLLESTNEGVWIADKDRQIQSVNKAYSDITGFQLADVEGKSFKLQTDFGRNHELESLIWQEVLKNGFWSGEVWTKKQSGEKISLHMSVTRVESENKLLGKMDVKFVGVFSDVTARKQSERDLRQLATRDVITNLPNRTLFIEQISHSIDTINPLNPHFAVMFIDLDNFKKVNENLGLLLGDELIKLVGERIKGCLAKGVTLARLGGDEFGIMIPSHLFSGVPAFYIKRVASDIKRELQNAFSLAQQDITISASIGVAIYPTHGDSAEMLMRCADTALNRVKITGRNNCLIYDHIMDDLSNNNLSLESELFAALRNDEFLVYYQPKYNIKENIICGFEALIRWQNPTRGLVPPDQFIAIAEENGFIRELDTWVLRKVCQQVKEWLQSDCMVGKVAVNISALNFQQAEFCQNIKQVVIEEGNLVEYLELEITESAMMQDPDKTLENMEILRSFGFSIALDDFGTGHSSLGYLKKFPIDRLKIDRTFIAEIEYSTQDRNITSVIVQLARHLGIDVIAEGIENEAQAFLLHVIGCSEIQGYFISRPIAAEQVEQFIKVDSKKIGNVLEAKDS